MTSNIDLYFVPMSTVGLTSDALDTPVCIMGAERGLKMITANGAEAWTQWIEGKRRHRAETPGFSRYFAPDEP